MAFLAGLGWLGWRSLQQDRAVEVQRVRDRLEGATDLIAAEIRQNLVDIEGQLARLSVLPDSSLGAAASAYSKNLREDALLVILGRDTVQAYPSRRLLYYPVLPIPEEPAGQVFATGETYEYGTRDFENAIAYFEELRASDDERIRAGALLRLARNQRKAGRPEAALATYSEFARLGDVSVDGRPAELVARRARCALLSELGRLPDLVTEARTLESDLDRGRWQLTRAAYVHFAGEAQQWLAASGAGQPASAGPGPVALSQAESVDSLWEQWHQDRRAPEMLAGRRSFVSHERSMLLLWRGTPDRLVALVAGPGFLQDSVVEPLRGVLNRQGVGVVLADGEGKTVVSYGTIGSPAQNVLLTMADTRLPWTLRVVGANPETNLTQLIARRRLLVAGLSFVALLVVAGSYFSGRAMTREIEVARLQSDFVAAVSHEFRTPLTLLRQFSDMLAEGRVSSEEERSNYYAALQRGTRRLTRLVENLLDFGRMEAGSHAFKIEPLPAREWIAQVTSEFQEEVRGQGYQVDVAWEGPESAVMRADETAMGRALWNLLDNAVKYSPVCKTIWVTGAFADDWVTISVRDRGIGVPAEEQHAIFGKFVRGSTPGNHVVKGTGLGLALVEQIVQAHGGTVRLDSIAGEGSTFWISLPAQV